MKLTFCGKQPLQRFFRIGVVGNNLADELVMIINKAQGDLRLDEFTPFIKIVNSDLTFVDKTRHFIFDVDTDPEKVRLIYVFPKKVTRQRKVDMQVLFQKSENDDTIIWQTEIFNATFDLEIDADEIIEQLYPDELQELDYRVTALEQKGGGVTEYIDRAHFPTVGDAAVIYIDTSKNIPYRYDTEINNYVVIGFSPDDITIINANGGKLKNG